MVVVCFSELRRVSSATLRLEKFVSGSCSASLTPLLSPFHFPVSGFMMYRKSELNKSVPVCTVAGCWSQSFVSNRCRVFRCLAPVRPSTRFCVPPCLVFFLKSMAATRNGWSLSELMERE